MRTFPQLSVNSDERLCHIRSVIIVGEHNGRCAATTAAVVCSSI